MNIFIEFNFSEPESFIAIAMIILFFSLFVLSPVVITILNIRNVFAKKKIIPRALLFLTVIMGLCFYVFCLDVCHVTPCEWNTATVIGEYHTPIASEYRFSFLALLGLGAASLFTLALVPAKKLPPLAASFALAGLLIGNLLNLFYAIHLAPFFFTKEFPYFEDPIKCEPLIFHFNILLLSLYYGKKQILEQILLMDQKIAKANSPRLKKLYAFLKKVSNWPIAAFLALIPLALLIEIILLLFGQGAAGPVKMFTMTADWTFSQQIPPPPLDHSGHYLCTVAAGGHKNLVKPLRFGNRRGRKIIVNRQLMVANAFEELLAEKAPALHKKIRRFYDSHGYPLSKIITTPLRADLVYLLMKPLEWLFALALYLFSTNPEERISRQYA